MMDKTISNNLTNLRTYTALKSAYVIPFWFALSIQPFSVFAAEPEEKESLKPNQIVASYGSLGNSKLLAPITVEEAEKNLKQMVKTIQFFHNDETYKNVKKREEKYSRKIEDYQKDLVAKGWDAQLVVQKYLYELNSQVKNMPSAIEEHQAMVADYQNQINSMLNNIQEFQFMINDYNKQNLELKVEKETLFYKYHNLLPEIEALSNEKQKLLTDKEALFEENQKLLNDQKALFEENQKLLSDKEALSKANQKLLAGKETLFNEKHKLGNEKEALSHEVNDLKSGSFWTWVLSFFCYSTTKTIEAATSSNHK